MVKAGIHAQKIICKAKYLIFFWINVNLPVVSIQGAVGLKATGANTTKSIAQKKVGELTFCRALSEQHKKVFFSLHNLFNLMQHCRMRKRVQIQLMDMMNGFMVKLSLSHWIKWNSQRLYVNGELLSITQTSPSYLAKEPMLILYICYVVIRSWRRKSQGPWLQTIHMHPRILFAIATK